MDIKKIEAEVIAMISKQLNKPASAVTGDKRIKEDLAADSLDIVEMLMQMEDKHNVTIPDEALAEVKTVDDLVRVLSETVK